MGFHILTQSRQCHEEIVDFDKTNGEVVAGAWVKPNGAFDKFIGCTGAEVPEIGACPVVLKSDRPDAGGYPINQNPAHVQVGIVDKITILRNWNDKMVLTSEIDVTTEAVAFGDQLTVIGGKLIKATLATQPIFGIYRGADSKFNWVEDGHFVQLLAQPQFDVV